MMNVLSPSCRRFATTNTGCRNFSNLLMSKIPSTNNGTSSNCSSISCKHIYHPKSSFASTASAAGGTGNSSSSTSINSTAEKNESQSPSPSSHQASASSSSSSSSFTEEDEEESRQPLVTPLPLIPRLERFYENVLYQDLMLLTYNHEEALKCKTDEDASASASVDLEIKNIFKTHIHDLPTRPIDTPYVYSGLLIKEKVKEKVKMIKNPLKNPIDYTSVLKHVLEAPPDAPPDAPFSYEPARMPRLLSVELEIVSEATIGNKSLVLSAIMSLQAISGVRPLPAYAKKSDAVKKIRKGMPMGARVVLPVSESYHFLDKMIQCVLPRIREWEGVNPVGNQNGSISFILPAASIGTFPDIEPHFDSFPRLFDTKVTINTTGVNDREAVLLLSGFQLPFLAKPKQAAGGLQFDISDDPWAAIKNAKTREERKAVFAAMQKQHAAEREAKKAAKEAE